MKLGREARVQIPGPPTSSRAWSSLRASTSSLPIVTLPAHDSKERSHVADEEIRLLHRSEMSAALELRPVHDVVRSLGEAPDRREYLVGELGHTAGHRRRLDPAPASA